MSIVSTNTYVAVPTKGPGLRRSPFARDLRWALDHPREVARNRWTITGLILVLLIMGNQLPVPVYFIG